MAFPRRLDTASSKASESVGCPCMTPAASSTVNIPSMVFAGGQKSPGYASEFGHMDHPHADFLTLGIHESNFIFTRQKIRYGVTNETDLSGYKY